MFVRVLFPTDFSAYANAVFDCLLQLKTAGMREVVLLSVVRESDVPLPESFNRDSLERIRWGLEEQLNIARIALEGQKLRVIVRIEYGSPPLQIVRVAAEERVQLIMMGTQGKTVSQELLLGSTAYEVVRRTSAPVLIEKAHVVRELERVECRHLCEQMFIHVLFPTDFSPCADQVFQLVKRLQAAGATKVTILHVHDKRVMHHRQQEQLLEFDQRDGERMTVLCRALQLYRLQAEAMLRHGLPWRETLGVDEEIKPSLIVIGLLGRSAIRELLAGNTFEDVVRLSRRPVLAVPCQIGKN